MNRFLTCVAIVALSGMINHVSAGPACDSIKWVTRKEWRAPDSMNHTGIDLPVKHVFLHHTAMSFCQTVEDCSKEMRIIYDLHIAPPRNWGDVGYNFLIGGGSNAKVYIGRNWNAVGHHTLGMNTESVAFSLMGNFNDRLPPKEMLDVAKNMIACGIEQGVIAENYQLHGHRDQSCTECPGDVLYHHIKQWPHYVRGPLPTYACNNP